MWQHALTTGAAGTKRQPSGLITPHLPTALQRHLIGPSNAYVHMYMHSTVTQHAVWQTMVVPLLLDWPYPQVGMHACEVSQQYGSSGIIHNKISNTKLKH